MGTPGDPLLKDSEERFRLLVESVKDYGIFILTPKGVVDTWNVGAERLKGYTADEIIGQHFSVFYPDADVARGKCEFELEEAARVGRFEDESWRVRKDGSRFWANVTITALRAGSGTLIGFAKVTRDLTERKAAEEEARRFRLLVESVKDYGIFILTPAGVVDTWNAGAERLKGWSATEIIGKHFAIFYPEVDVAAGKCEMELAEAARVGRYEDEGWRVRKDGTRFWANVTLTALRNDQGALIGFAKVTRDLTERVATEQNLRQLAADRATIAERAQIQDFQERFVAILGHDLRNPLAAIEMGAALLRQQQRDLAPNPRAASVLRKVESSTRRMSRMIEQILDLTRSRLADGLEVNPVPMDLAVMLGEVADELRTAHPSRTIDVRANGLAGVWDRDRLEQVFSNLIGNAIHYGASDRPVKVAAGCENDVVWVNVHNEGPAIPVELLARLFDPFRRGTRDSRTASTAGLGLGLYISREILTAHGGDITVRSSEAEGTTFRITMPLVTFA